MIIGRSFVILDPLADFRPYLQVGRVKVVRLHRGCIGLKVKGDLRDVEVSIHTVILKASIDTLW